MSRCMWARSFVMTAAMTRSAAPFANSACAICSIIRPVVRSDMPIGDRALADDLDVAALERRAAEVLEPEAVVVAHRRIPVLERRVLEHRMRAVDRAHVVGLAATRRPVHRVDRDAAVDPARGVAREERVRERRQDEGGVVVDRRRDERRVLELAEVEAGLGDRQPADQVTGQRVGLEGRQRRRRTGSTRLGPTTASEATELDEPASDRPRPWRAPRPAGPGRRAPRRPVRASGPRTGRAPTAPARPRGRRRTAARRGWRASVA